MQDEKFKQVQDVMREFMIKNKRLLTDDEISTVLKESKVSRFSIIARKKLIEEARRGLGYKDLMVAFKDDTRVDKASEDLLLASYPKAREEIFSYFQFINQSGTSVTVSSRSANVYTIVLNTDDMKTERAKEVVAIYPKLIGLNTMYSKCSVVPEMRDGNDKNWLVSPEEYLYMHVDPEGRRLADIDGEAFVKENKASYEAFCEAERSRLAKRKVKGE